MDLGVIANMKAMYKRRIQNAARISAKNVSDVREFVKELKIFDAILHCKVAWEAVSPDTIMKYLKKSGVHD